MYQGTMVTAIGRAGYRSTANKDQDLPYNLRTLEADEAEQERGEAHRAGQPQRDRFFCAELVEPSVRDHDGASGAAVDHQLDPLRVDLRLPSAVHRFHGHPG